MKLMWCILSSIYAFFLLNTIFINLFYRCAYYTKQMIMYFCIVLSWCWLFLCTGFLASTLSCFMNSVHWPNWYITIATYCLLLFISVIFFYKLYYKYVIFIHTIQKHSSDNVHNVYIPCIVILDSWKVVY